MTQKEIGRNETFSKISHKRITQKDAAAVLGLGLRQVQRIYREYKKNGILALISKKRGKPSNNQMDPIIKTRIEELINYDLYRGFRPTFMKEKLEELHNVKISVETTRQLMMQAGIWKAKQKKSPVVHQQRKRRARVGELVQIDGSPHPWFEDRADPCTLIVYIDDATGRTYGRFSEAETSADYMKTTLDYIKLYGRPIAFYSDRHGIFRVNIKDQVKKESLTQFSRALKELDIELICANSPQAKGRVENVNKTLQDRLVKELRLAGINSIEEGNRFLQSFWFEFNKKFNVLPENSQEAHRPLLKEQNLDRILCFKEYRKISKNLEVQYKNIIYQIVENRPVKGLAKSQVQVLENLEGKIFSIEYRGKPLAFREYGKQEASGREVYSKEIDYFFREKEKREISFHHPWLQEGRAEGRKRVFANL